MINDSPTHDMSVWEGMRALRGAPGSKVTVTVIRGNAADPHLIELTREADPTVEVTGRIAAPGVGYVRVGRGWTENRRAGEVSDRGPHEKRRVETDRRRPPHLVGFGG
jgi:hypothetical protein